MREQDYRALILEDYDEKLAKGTLAPELMVPTRGSLKDHAANACATRYKAKDEPLLQSFFGPKDNPEAYYRAINLAKAEKFRTLHNFLVDRTIEPSFLNITMLAWLIDFEPRPYRMDLPLPPVNPKPPIVSPPVNLLMPEQPAIPLWWSRNKLVIAVVILISIVGGICLFNSKKTITGKEGCMIWEDDHYQPIECTESTPGKLHYPINHQLVNNFKRITRPDTITYYSAKKIWYSNLNGRVEFFTAQGPYPLDTSRRVLKVSEHTIKKYIYHITN